MRLKPRCAHPWSLPREWKLVAQRAVAGARDDCLTALGTTIAETYGSSPPAAGHEFITAMDRPSQSESGIRTICGNLAPNGAIPKRSASSRKLWKDRGQAVVFDGYQDMLERIARDDLEATADSVLMLRNCGPSAIGVPDWCEIPIPVKLFRAGVRVMMRTSDARISGTSYGTAILHVSPEAAVGGAIATLRDGDWIELDVEAGTLDVRYADRGRKADARSVPCGT